MSPQPSFPSDLHVVLVEPEIPGNTGNVGRTCLATGVKLHLVRPLGFSLSERRVRRAGLDYWRHVDPVLWEGWSHCEAALPDLGTPYFFSTDGGDPLWEVEFEPPSVLVFGGETSGLPQTVRRRRGDRWVRLPMITGPVRSLNLSTAVAVAVYEVLRQRSRRDSGILVL